jgi:hypothetical protein
MWHSAAAFASVVGVVALCTARPVLAANPASDNAADPAYIDGWQSGDNGGSGLGQWMIQPFGTGAVSIASSTLNGDTNNDGDIDTLGKSWALWAGTNGFVGAFRNLTGGNLLSGQQIVITGDYMPPTAPNATYSSGFALGNTLNQQRFFVGLQSGSPQYFIQDGTGVRMSGIAPTPDGLRFSFTLTTVDTYSLQITELGSGAVHPFTGVLGGTLGSGINHFGLFADYTSGYSQQDAFFNSIEVIIPEPAGPALLVTLFLPMMSRRWRTAAVQNVTDA